MMMKRKLVAKTAEEVKAPPLSFEDAVRHERFLFCDVCPVTGMTRAFLSDESAPAGFLIEAFADSERAEKAMAAIDSKGGDDAGRT